MPYRDRNYAVLRHRAYTRALKDLKDLYPVHFQLLFEARHEELMDEQEEAASA